jgi:hypothetical protein
MSLIKVGFDGTPTRMQYAPKGDILFTSGLSNCIAIVAYYSDNSGAVMRHYDTNKLFPDIQSRSTLTPIPQSLGAQKLYSLQYTLVKFLRANDYAQYTWKPSTPSYYTQLIDHNPSSRTQFTYALGNVWQHIGPLSAFRPLLDSLIALIQLVFSIQPIGAGRTAFFDVSTARLIVDDSFIPQYFSPADLTYRRNIPSIPPHPRTTL